MSLYSLEYEFLKPVGPWWNVGMNSCVELSLGCADNCVVIYPHFMYTTYLIFKDVAGIFR